VFGADLDPHTLQTCLAASGILINNNKTGRLLVLVSLFGLTTHLILDLFGSATPLLWPLVSQSFLISSDLRFRMGSAPTVTGTVTFTAHPPTVHFTTFKAPLLTAEGLGVSLLLLTLAILLPQKERDRGKGNEL